MELRGNEERRNRGIECHRSEGNEVTKSRRNVGKDIRSRENEGK